MATRAGGALMGLLALMTVYGLAQVPWGWAPVALLGLAGGAALADRVRRLKLQAERDELTGLWNRRPFERTLQLVWNRAMRSRRPFSLLFLDVDDFGQVNKRYGHLMGDEALKTVGRTIRVSVRSTDLLARWGGEEFVLVLTHADSAEALAIAERIRTQVEQATRQECGVPITVSTGVSSFPGAANTPEALLRQAMDAQAVAKQQKNAISVVS